VPGGKPGGIRHQALVQTVDLLPTVLGVFGIRPDEELQLHGHDLLTLIRGEQTKVRDYACMGMDVEEFALRTHLWHLILPIVVDPDEPRTAELYRKPEDRWDQNNVIEQHPEVADQLELALRRFVEALSRNALEDLAPLRDVARFGVQ
jgi:arylsulfatase A-like enzyme